MATQQSNANQKSSKDLAVKRRGDFAPQEFRPIRDLQRSVRRLFDDFFETDFPFAGNLPLTDDLWSAAPAADVEETDNEFHISMDVPGVPKKNIQVEVRGNNLTISGERKEEFHEKDRRRRFTERTYGSFYRSFPLPSNVDSDRIKADYHDGVIEIALPKTEPTPVKTIPILEG